MRTTLKNGKFSLSFCKTFPHLTSWKTDKCFQLPEKKRSDRYHTIPDNTRNDRNVIICDECTVYYVLKSAPPVRRVTVSVPAWPCKNTCPWTPWLALHQYQRPRIFCYLGATTVTKNFVIIGSCKNDVVAVSQQTMLLVKIIESKIWNKLWTGSDYPQKNSLCIFFPCFFLILTQTEDTWICIF